MFVSMSQSNLMLLKRLIYKQNHYFCLQTRGLTQRSAQSRGSFSFDKIVMFGLCICTAITISDAYYEGRENLQDSIQCSDSTSHYLGSSLKFTDLEIKTLERDGFVVLQNVLSKVEVKNAMNDVKFGSMAELLNIPSLPTETLDYRSDKFICLGHAERDAVTARRDNHLIRQKDAQGFGGEAAGEALLHAQLVLRNVGSCLQQALFRGFDAQNDRQTQGEKDTQLASLCIPRSLQLSHYSPDKTFYTPHRDAATFDFREGLLTYLRQHSYRKRYVTAILYLNDTSGPSLPWIAETDGGQLRLFPYDGQEMMDSKTPNRTAESIDILPTGGTLVVFDSQRLLHEVRPTSRDRYALTCWFTVD